MSTYKTVATWNVQRGGKYLDIARMLRDNAVDIALLQECDVGMARSGNIHVPRLVSKELGYDYSMAIEFEEEGIGNDKEREQFPRATNKNGLHCNAILARSSMSITNTIHLSRGREWQADRVQPRNGGRVALAVELDGIFYVSTHLENRTTAVKRFKQFRRLLRVLDKGGARRVVIGGDFNVRDFGDTAIFTHAEECGYSWADANDDVGRFQGNRFDWFFYRGVEVSHPQTIDATGVSDHDLMLLRVYQ